MYNKTTKLTRPLAVKYSLMYKIGMTGWDVHLSLPYRTNTFGNVLVSTHQEDGFSSIIAEYNSIQELLGGLYVFHWMNFDSGAWAWMTRAQEPKANTDLNNALCLKTK